MGSFSPTEQRADVLFFYCASLCMGSQMVIKNDGIKLRMACFAENLGDDVTFFHTYVEALTWIFKKKNSTRSHEC